MLRAIGRQLKSLSSLLLVGMATGRTAMKDDGACLPAQEPSRSHSRPWAFTGKEVVEAKPNEALLLLQSHPSFYPQPDRVWESLVSMNILAVRLTGERVHWFQVTRFHSALTTP